MGFSQVNELEAKAVAMLMRNEGYRRFVYHDTRGVPTVGFGRNLETRGIDLVEAGYLLEHDVRDAMKRLVSFRCWEFLNEPRRLALIDITVNMGFETVLTFKKMLAWLDTGAWKRAADELLNSRAHEQEKARIERDAEMIRSGEMP